MRNYIILNDINSNTINGLLIQELPPVSKPKMRTRVEEIDGRAGDIITQLGFKAYDKTIKIGLYGDFDINEVISYFNSSGQVVFSNEPDKYYNYQIVDQIDYERLIRFRTAKVKMHVQPFKYPTEEEPLVGQYQYVTNTGSNMSLDNTANALFKKFDLKGNTSQDGTPTPSSPIPVNVVSGDNTINIDSGNVLSNVELITGYIDSNNTIQTASGWFHTDYIDITNYDLYIVDRNIGTNPKSILYDINKQPIQVLNLNIGNQYDLKNYANAKYIRVSTTESALAMQRIIVRTTYPIYLGVENLLDSILENKTIDGNGIIVNNNSYSLGIAKVEQGQTYTFDGDNLGDTSVIGFFNDKPILGSTTYNNSRITLTNGVRNFNAPINGYVAFRITSTGTNIKIGIGLNYISSQPIELCKIGDYQDYIYKDNGSWYLHKEIGKVVLDGSEDATQTSNTSYSATILRFDVPISNKKLNTGDAVVDNILCNMFPTMKLNYDARTQESIAGHRNTPTLEIFIDSSRLSSSNVAGFKAWLSTNNPIAYYLLDTPTNTEITDDNLIEQLEALKQANSYDGQTNINHEYNGSPFILDVAAVQKGSDELVVDNEGNIYSRPTLDLEGTGIVNVYLEGNQMFQVDLTDTNEIVIDTDEMEAYNPTTQALMNRQVTGNYDNFKLNVGDNTLKFSGDLTKATVSGYVRWL